MTTEQALWRAIATDVTDRIRYGVLADHLEGELGETGFRVEFLRRVLDGKPAVYPVPAMWRGPTLIKLEKSPPRTRNQIGPTFTVNTWRASNDRHDDLAISFQKRRDEDADELHDFGVRFCHAINTGDEEAARQMTYECLHQMYVGRVTLLGESGRAGRRYVSHFTNEYNRFLRRVGIAGVHFNPYELEAVRLARS